MLLKITFIAFIAACSGEESPEVTVKQGKLRGKIRITRNNRTFNAFEGIPFAQPPLGPLRFQPPQAIKSWENVKDATKIHNICPQRDIYRRSEVIEGDEDCLYLNVYTPQLAHSDLLPIMIFFHGGGWLCGGGNSLWYGPDILLDRDVVLVVTNYRLGALGFLSTGDTILPGNNGMKDQNMAIRWVKENAEAFGGDPHKITLFGESAGGASVQLHMMSPLSKDLFQAAISQSGTAHCLWALAPKDQGIKHAKQLAESFNCNSDSSENIVECLRKIPAKDLVAKDKIFMKWDTDPMIPFKPVVEPNIDGAFITQHPIEYLKSGQFAQVPWIIGLNKDDGALRAASIFGNSHLIEELDKNFDKIVPISLLYDETSQHVDYITRKIRKFYLGSKKITAKDKATIVDLYTDGWFLNAADEAIRYYLKYAKKPVYYYLFSHRGIASFTEIFGDKEHDYGVCHADELQYLFPVSDGLFPDRPPTNDDKKIAKIMSTLWANFARTGNPTPENDDLFLERWLPVTTDKDMEYYDISVDGPKMKKGLYKDRTEFWRKLPLHAKTNEIKDEL